MAVVMPTWVQLVFLVCSVCIILALTGLRGPRTARTGNLIGAAAVVVACAVPFLWTELDLHHVPLILGAIALGSLGGLLGAQRVTLAQVPQTVALCNGLGGAAASLVLLVELKHLLVQEAEFDGLRLFGWLVWAATAFAVVAGSMAFAGSIVTGARLQEVIGSRPTTFPGLPFALGGAGVLALALAVQLVQTPSLWLGVALAVLGLAIGVLLILPVGGSDLPVVLSLLNALTGLSVAAGGYVLDNLVLLVAGSLVGASGTVLTRTMARRRGRSVLGILFGAPRDGSTPRAAAGSGPPVRSVSPEDVARLLGYADRVVVVPGYGLAVARAHHTLRELVDVLIARGATVDYAIHPVAGRMPGHMNALLAEAQVPYDQLIGLDDINSQFAQTDVVLVVGANDVVNPAARTTPSAPIYGMPILRVDQAAEVVVLKRSLGPGYAGISNELLFAPSTSVLLGDAKDSLRGLLDALRPH